MKAYKGFNKDMTCRGFQFEEGKEYVEEKAELCKSGFHACEYPLDCFGYYPPSDSVYHEVDLDYVDQKTGEDSNRCGEKIKIGAELTIADIVKASVSYINERAESKTPNTGNCSAATNTGDCSAATNTGDCSAATNTGNRSAATNTGPHSAATNTGNSSASTNTGRHSAATNTGCCSVATNTGNSSVATNTGDHSAATNTGDHSAATNTGYCSVATNTGDYSAATNTGNRSAVSVSGNRSVAMAIGYKSKAKGAVGCWLVLSEHDEDYNIVDVQCHKVDGETIKPDTYYCLEDGKFKECVQ